MNTKSKYLLYIVGPYSGKNHEEISENIKRAEDVSISLIRNGFHVITPHKNTAHYEVYEDDDLTRDSWIAMNLDILSRCDGIYVMKGYTKSTGSLKEIDYAKSCNKPLFFEDYVSADEMTPLYFMARRWFDLPTFDSIDDLTFYGNSFQCDTKKSTKHDDSTKNENGIAETYENIGKKLGALVDIKNAKYGESFHRMGDIMCKLYPNGISIEQYDDILAIVRVLDKIFRIATDKDAFGENPWNDIAGYAILKSGGEK